LKRRRRRRGRKRRRRRRRRRKVYSKLTQWTRRRRKWRSKAYSKLTQWTERWTSSATALLVPPCYLPEGDLPYLSMLPYRLEEEVVVEEGSLLTSNE